MSGWPPLEDLIWLFEVEPIVEFEDLGYPGSVTTFVSQRGDTLIECSIEAYTNSMTLRCEERGEERLRLHLWGIIREVHVDRLHGREALVASILDTVPFRELRLEMKPTPRLTWAAIAPWAPDASI